MSILIVLLGLIGVLVGFAIVARISAKPQLFWPILIVGSIITTGIMFLGRFTWLDEYLVACVILGSLASGGGQRVIVDNLERLHRFVFTLLIIYFVIECFRGIIVLYSPRKIRWVVFYVMLGILITILRKKKHIVPSVREMSFLVTVGSLVYFGSYLGTGVISELLGISKSAYEYWSSIGAPLKWGSSAYSMFPIAIAMPAALIIIKDKSRAFRRLGWITLIVLVFTAIYFDSRVSILTIIAFLIISLPNLGLLKTIKLLIMSAIIFGVFLLLVGIAGKKGKSGLDYFVRDVFSSSDSLWKSGSDRISGRDSNRHIWMKSGFIAINDNWVHRLFGYGFRTSGYVVAPYVHDLFQRSGQQKEYEENPGTEAITNLVVDTGMVGLFLLILNCILVAHRIIFNKGNPNKSLLLLSLLVMLGWLFVINIVDVMLFYLAIMPSGFLVQLSRNQRSPNFRYPKLAPRKSFEKDKVKNTR